MDDDSFAGRNPCILGIVGKDTTPYATNTSLWSVGTFTGNKVSVIIGWPVILITNQKSGLQRMVLNFVFQNRLNSVSHTIQIFFQPDFKSALIKYYRLYLRQVDTGDVYNKV